jgi:two-component system sensor histidine kinase UhpB
LTTLTTDLSTHTGLAIHRRFEPDLPKLDQQTELVLYRVAQESLTNVARHADATQVGVQLYRDGDRIRLLICDDGRGFGLAQEGAGLRGMRERALLIGAVLDLEATPGGGVQIGMSVPLHADGSDHV